MDSSQKSCSHKDVRDFDGLRYCLACGEAILNDPHPSTPPTPTLPKRYRYSRLNYERGQEIRLLRLHPAMNYYEQLTCDIFHVNIAEKPVYEAVSYTWATQDGDSSLSESICDRATGTNIAITKNCEAALRYLRLKGSKRVLWVDAIAINQHDDSERSHQVKFMSTIYSGASQVLMFLGAESPDAKRVLDYLNGTPPSDVWNHISLVEQDVRSFLQRHYFSRVWTLQEIALAKLVTLVVGNKTLPWTTATIDLLRQLRTVVRTVTLMPGLLQWQPASELGHDLLDVLHRSRSCSATDPRDKVFAVLGLVQHDVATKFPVDYSMTPGEVFTHMSVYLMKSRNCLDILKHVTLGNPAAGCPTWVVSWDSYDAWYSHKASDPLAGQFTESEIRALSQTWYVPDGLKDHKRIQRFEELLNHGVLDNSLTMDIGLSTAGWRSAIWSHHAVCLDFASALSQSSDLRSSEAGLLGLFTSFKRDRDFRYAVYKLSDAGKLVLPIDDDWHSSSILRTRAHYLDTIVCAGPELQTGSHGFECLPRSEIRCTDCANHIAPKIWDVRTDFDAPRCRAGKQRLLETLNATRGEDRDNNQNQDLYQTVLSIGSRAIGFPQADDSIWAIDGVDMPVVLKKIEDHYILVGTCHLYQATKHAPCGCCGADAKPWPMETHIIDIW